MNIKITGTGSYIPEIVQDNSKFLDRNFFDNEGNRIETKNEEIIKFGRSLRGRLTTLRSNLFVNIPNWLKNGA